MVNFPAGDGHHEIDVEAVEDVAALAADLIARIPLEDPRTVTVSVSESDGAGRVRHCTVTIEGGGCCACACDECDGCDCDEE